MGSNAGIRLVRSAPFLLVLLASLVSAQDYRGRIQGVVTDSSNAVIAGAGTTYGGGPGGGAPAPELALARCTRRNLVAVAHQVEVGQHQS